MALTFRFRTASGSGPPTVFGKVVATLFGLGFVAIGGVFTYLVGRETAGIARQWSWEQTTCRILESGVGNTGGSPSYVFQVRYRYEVTGVAYEGGTYRSGYSGSSQISDAQRLADRYAPGLDVLCFVDPKSPARSALARPKPWFALVIFLPLLFVGFGSALVWSIRASGREGKTHGRKALSQAAVLPRRAAGCMAAFFTVFLVFGAGFSLFFVVPAFRNVAARSWPAVPCTVLSSEVRSHSSDDGTTYSVGVLYSYEVRGRTYRSSRYQFLAGSSSGRAAKERAVARYPPGSSCTCYVNPADPHDAVLTRAFGAEYLITLVPLLFLTVGVVGLVFALRKVRAAGLAPAAAPGGFSFAAVEPAPSGPVVLKSPGPVTKFVVTTLVTLFWNGIVGVMVREALQGWRAGDRPYGLTCFFIPFALVGAVLVVATVSSFLAMFNPRLVVTLSSGAIPLGGSATVDWKFRGATSRITRVTVVVEGREEASYRSGSSTHTDRSTFARIPVFDASGSGAATAVSTTLSIPADSMHSFAAGNNKIVWTLKLRGEIPSWPDVAQDYDIDVRPVVGGREP